MVRLLFIFLTRFLLVSGLGGACADGFFVPSGGRGVLALVHAAFRAADIFLDFLRLLFQLCLNPVEEGGEPVLEFFQGGFFRIGGVKGEIHLGKHLGPVLVALQDRFRRGPLHVSPRFGKGNRLLQRLLCRVESGVRQVFICACQILDCRGLGGNAVDGMDGIPGKLDLHLVELCFAEALEGRFLVPVGGKKLEIRIQNVLCLVEGDSAVPVVGLAGIPDRLQLGLVFIHLGVQIGEDVFFGFFLGLVGGSFIAGFGRIGRR